MPASASQLKMFDASVRFVERLLFTVLIAYNGKTGKGCDCLGRVQCIAVRQEGFRVRTGIMLVKKING